jgi:hypothetical protein
MVIVQMAAKQVLLLQLIVADVELFVLFEQMLQQLVVEEFVLTIVIQGLQIAMEIIVMVVR